VGHIWAAVVQEIVMRLAIFCWKGCGMMAASAEG
jgi:hypothetical protein